MRVALELHLQRLAVVAAAVADVAGDVDVGQEVHLDLDQAVALARLAAAALDVEAEAAGLVAARLALGQAGEPVADLGEGAGVGRRVGARGAADRRLVDVDHLVEMLEAGDLLVRAGEDAGAVQRARGGGVERVDGEARLARCRETPVTQVKVPSGIAAVTSLRLLARGAVDGDASCRCPCGAWRGAGSRGGR